MSTTLDLDGTTLTLPTAHDLSWDTNLNNTITAIVNKANATETRLDATDTSGVTLTGTQTLTNKTLTSPTINGAALSGTITGTPNFTGPPTVSGAAVVTTTGTQTLTNKTLSGSVSGAAFPLEPGGRLTLTTAVPVTTSDVTGATTIYYSPHRHNVVWLYDGTTWTSSTFSELSQATTDNTKSPAAVANNSNYDLFVWNDAGTLRCTRGFAWTLDTGRGTGAGTTELELLDGRHVNKIAITNGPAAQRGLYVGTVRSNGSAQINDSMLLRHVWNKYHRALRPMRRLESTASWAYTSTTVREANGSTANRLQFVRGLDEDAVTAFVRALVANTASGVSLGAKIGLDSTTVHATGSLPGSSTTKVANIREPLIARYNGFPGLGSHFVSWLEDSQASGTTTWTGGDECGIHAEMMA